MDRKRPAGKVHGLPVAKAVDCELRTVQLIPDPGTVAILPLEDRGFPGILESGRRGTDAVYPARDSEQVIRRGEPHTHGFPHALLHVAIDVRVAGNDEQTVEAEIEFRAQRLEEIRYFGVFVRPARLRGIAGEENKMDESFFFEQRFQISPPWVAQNSATAPWLFLSRALGVEVRNMQKLQTILPVCHGLHTV